MPKIKMLTTMANASGSAQIGQIVDLPQEEADELIAGGYAEPVKSAAIETAMIAPAENTALQPELIVKSKAKKGKE